MDVTNIVKEYGAYYEKAGQNKNRILALLTQGLVTPGYCTTVKTDDTIFRLGSLTIGHIVQAFQKAWTPKADIAFQPNELRLYKMKADIDLEPDDIEATWLGFLADEKVSRKDWPLVKFLIEHPEQGIIARINSDMEMKEYGHGQFVAPTPGTAGTTGESMDGFIKQLQTGIDNETINHINVGNLDKDTIFDQVEEFVVKLGDLYRYIQMPIFMSQENEIHYHRDKRGQNFYQIQSEAQVNRNVDFVPQFVVGLPSLNGTNIMFSTPKVNMMHLTKKYNNKTRFDLQEAKRVVNVLADWWEGVGFGIDGAVFTNLAKSGSGSVSE